MCRQRAPICICPRKSTTAFCALTALLLFERCFTILPSFFRLSLDSCDTSKGKKLLLGLITSKEGPSHPVIPLPQKLRVAVPVQCLLGKLAVPKLFPGWRDLMGTRVYWQSGVIAWAAPGAAQLKVTLHEVYCKDTGLCSPTQAGTGWHTAMVILGISHVAWAKLDGSQKKA